MTLNKNDFVEIEFTGKLKDTNEIFDTNIKSDAEKAGLQIKDIKPFTLSIGHKMLPEGLDKDLEDKEVGKEYSIELKPEQAFGKRNSQFVRMIPLKIFHQQKINPQKGMQLSMDGQLVRVLSNSGGRVLVDFNNPLAGKDVVYDYKILRKIDDKKEQINALQDFLFRKRFEFDLLEDQKKATFKIEKQLEPFLKMFSEKFKEMTGFAIDSKIVEPQQESKKE